MKITNTETAILTARLLDRLLPFMGDAFVQRFEESIDESILAIDGHEAELGRLIDRTSDEEYEAGTPPLGCWHAEEAEAKKWLASVRAAIADAVLPNRCERCDGSGEIARSITTGSYVCPGPVYEYATRIVGSRCDACNGSGLEG